MSATFAPELLAKGVSSTRRELDKIYYDISKPESVDPKDATPMSTSITLERWVRLTGVEVAHAA